MVSRALILTCSVALLGACSSARADDPTSTIVVPAYVNHEAVHQFEKAQGHHLTREEMLSIHGTWIDNEILYREGLKQSAASADPADRDKVISTMRGTMDQQVRPVSVADDDLRRWYESRRDKYVQPARFDFEDAVLSGQASQEAARALADKLNGGATADIRAFKGRPEWNLVQSYGQEVVDALGRAAPGKWLAVHSRDGWRTLRVTAKTPPTETAFDTRKDSIRRDYLEATTVERRQAAVLALRNKYRIEFDPTHDCASDK